MANRTNHTSSDQSIITSQAEESEREQGRRYGTRYGIMTASEAALDMLDRATERISFMESIFAIVHHDGDGSTMPGYSSEGLAAILEDIKHDLRTVYSYYDGGDPTPGKEYDAPEVGHE